MTFADWFLEKLHEEAIKPPRRELLRDMLAFRAGLRGAGPRPPVVFGRFVTDDAVRELAVSRVDDEMARVLADLASEQRSIVERLAAESVDDAVKAAEAAGDRALPIFAPLLAARVSSVRRVAATLYARNACPDVRLLLEERLDAEPDPTIVETIVAAIGRIGDERSRFSLLEAKKRRDETDTLLATIAEAIGAIGATSLLSEMLRSFDANERLAAVWGLGERKDAAAAAELVAALDDSNDDVARYAAQALGKCRVRDAVPRLIELFGASAPTSPRRVGVLEAFARMPDARAIACIAKALLTDDQAIVDAALDATRELAVAAELDRLALERSDAAALLDLAERIDADEPAFQAIERLREKLDVGDAKEEALARPIYVPERVGKACLHELRKVPWARMPHAYWFRSPRTPTLLRQLTSRSADTRQSGYDDILSVLWHQGTTFVQTAHAVPFLVALAVDRRPWSGYAMAALVLIAEGDARDERIDAKIREAFRACRAALEMLADGPAPFSEAAERILAILDGEPVTTREDDDADDLVDALQYASDSD